MQESTVLWPLAGLVHFLFRPKLWPGALLANAGAWALTLAAALAVCYFTWPGFNQDQWWLWYLFDIALSIGWGLLAFIFCWMVAVPIILGMAYERLTRRILIDEGYEVVEEGAIAAARSSITFVFKTLHWRLGWMAIGVVTLFFPPLSWLAATLGLGHVALLDACDVAMAMRGRSGSERAKLIREHRSDLLLGGFAAGLAGQILGTTVIGWLFWMPGLFVAAARTCPTWCIDEPAVDDATAPAIETTPAQDDDPLREDTPQTMIGTIPDPKADPSPEESPSAEQKGEGA